MEKPEIMKGFPFLTFNIAKDDGLAAKYCLGFGDWKIECKDKFNPSLVRTIYWSRQRNENLRAEGRGN